MVSSFSHDFKLGGPSLKLLKLIFSNLKIKLNKRQNRQKIFRSRDSWNTFKSSNIEDPENYIKISLNLEGIQTFSELEWLTLESPSGNLEFQIRESEPKTSRKLKCNSNNSYNRFGIHISWRNLGAKVLKTKLKFSEFQFWNPTWENDQTEKYYRHVIF